ELNLIAISMGGMIAIDWMNRYPTEIKSTVLINTSLRNYSPFYQRLRWQTYPSIINHLFRHTEQIEQLILTLTSNTHENNAELLKSWNQWRKQYPISNINTLNQLLAAAKFSSKIKPLHPLLIVASKKDRLVDYRCSLALQNAWQVDYQEHDTAGHDLPLDEPYWMAQTIHQWHSDL
ncbi:MAG: alpha/beta hydrolase, partial [Methylococcales bacterium]|nr:alpha/beta hydrolase [Methylococcales bacterium]